MAHYSLFGALLLEIACRLGRNPCVWRPWGGGGGDKKKSEDETHFHQLLLAAIPVNLRGNRLGIPSETQVGNTQLCKQRSTIGFAHLIFLCFGIQTFWSIHQKRHKCWFRFPPTNIMNCICYILTTVV